jgi:hypothetical protein
MVKNALENCPEAFIVGFIQGHNPELHNLLPVMEQQWHRRGERTCTLSKFNESRRKVELLPVLQGGVEMGFMILSIQNEIRNGVKRIQTSRSLSSGV